MHSSVLVTGASGFIGFHVVKRLLESSVQRVVALDRDDQQNALRPLPSDPRLSRARFTLGVDPDSKLEAICEGVTHVIHLAAVKQREALDHPQRALHENCAGMLQLIECCAKK